MEKLPGQGSMKKYLLKKATTYGRDFNKLRVEEWVRDFSQMANVRFEAESGCRRIRELRADGYLRITKGKGIRAWYRIVKQPK